jgi:hypothetical protein
MDLSKEPFIESILDMENPLSFFVIKISFNFRKAEILENLINNDT